MCNVNWQLVLEDLKVLLSWPPIGLVTALSFVTRFRSAIDDFLNHLVEENIFGQVFKAVPPSQKADAGGGMYNAALDAANFCQPAWH